jgi:peptidoglycan/xylan/chitin deacetylase (PgdA/CDA1 family)
MKNTFKLTFLLILTISFFLACNPQANENDKVENKSIDNNINQVIENKDDSENYDGESLVNVTENDDSLEEEENNDVSTEVEEEIEAETIKKEKLIESYQAHKVNEIGQVMVIMYHNLAETPGLYATTPAMFKEDLIRLHTSGYRLINMSDLINNTIDIPLGTTPVVLTFDDGAKSNFYYDENGEIAKDSVIGIFNEVKTMYDDFIPKGVFYLYGSVPFRQPAFIEKKLNYLVENGYEIGNHSYDHEKLNELSIKQIEKAIGKQAQFLESFVKDYEVKHISIPYGLRPGDDKIDWVFSGTYDEIPYRNISAVNVGWNPVMPYGHQKFNPRSINRITCGFDDFEMHYWLDYFDKNPHKKYISDGDSNSLVVPRELLEQVNEDNLEKVIIYDAKEEE